MVIVHANVEIKPEARDRWLETAKAAAVASRSEEACESYVVYEAIEAPNVFVFVERWASLEGLYAHFRAPHFAELLTALATVSARPPEGSVLVASSETTLDEALRAAGVGG